MWEPIGLVYDQHAQLPTPFQVNDVLRMYFSDRLDGKSRICFIDLDAKTLKVASDKKVALEHGEEGMFDHAGVMPSCTLKGDDYYPNLMFYTGWNLRKDVPYSHSIGAAVINEDGNLTRISKGPVLSQNTFDPFLLNSPFVERNDEFWEMWYCSGTGWIDQYPTYHISYAHSRSPYSWTPMGHKSITHSEPDEAISRVWKHQTEFYYSFRTKDTPYSLWKQAKQSRELVRIERSDWDSEMQCYPAIWNNCIFYNGNGYGSTGIGVAKWKTVTG